MRSILRDHVLSFEQQAFLVLDLVLAGVAEGCWPELERRSAAGLAAAQEEPPPADAVREAGRAFRYERGLIAAADLEAWLDARGLTTGDWQGHLRRAVARERIAAAMSADATSVLRADAICTGTLRACGDRIVEGAAAERVVGRTEADARWLVEAARATTASGLETVSDAELEQHAETVARIEAAREVLRAAPGADEIARCVAGHALDWMRFETVELEVAVEDAAREAVLCVREDASSLAAIGVELGSEAVVRSRTFLATPAELRGGLASAQAGDVVGPVASDRGFVVAQLLAKERPSTDDPAVVERARAQLLAATSARHAAGRVSRHAAL